MNSKFKELAERAGYPDYMTYGQDKVLEMFAELIVKECITQVEKDLLPNEQIIEGYNEDWNSTLEFAAEQIKEHFGIEIIK